MVYPFSPRFCHRFVGYLEEEAVKTYTLCLEVSTCTGRTPPVVVVVVTFVCLFE